MAIGYRCDGCSIVRADRWRGTCPGCGGFYSIRRTATSVEGAEEGPPPRGQLVSLNDVTAATLERISCGFAGVDKILGTDPVTGLSGIAAKGGQAIQIYGAPGVGKSSWLIQVAQNLAKQRYPTLYVIGEESIMQVKARADRIIKKIHKNLVCIEETDLDAILYQLDEVRPTVAVIDSINTVAVEDYAAGSTSAMRIAARELYKFTQTNGICLILVVQMNKAGDDFTGPKELEHIVDTSLFFTLDRKGRRVLRCDTKNRFGSTPAEQLFEMRENGLFEIDDVPEEPPAPPTTTPEPPVLRSVP